MTSENRRLTLEQIEEYKIHLCESERSSATVQKYEYCLLQLYTSMQGRTLTKSNLIQWKQMLIEQYALATVNAMLAAINGFFQFMNWNDLIIRQMKMQKVLFQDEQKELTKSDYQKLVCAAKEKKDERLALVIQTICATGIRVSELKYITVEAVRSGRVSVSNKGKYRVVFLPAKLCELIKRYLKKQKRATGMVFVTRTGRPMDRSNIWRAMKALCEKAGVEPEKVFPHNLRHLFARTYYAREKDLSRLADILGHSSVSTTRIYTAESGNVHARQIERMGLVMI